MNWWSGYSEIECTFALDANSNITNEKVFFTNKPSRYLTFLNGTSKARVQKTFGYKYTNFTLSNLDLHEYTSLNISDTNLIFDTPQPIEDSFTLILKCKVNQSTVFLSNNAYNFGPTFGVNVNSNIIDIQDDAGAWSCSGYTTGDLFSQEKKFAMLRSDIKTLVIKGRMSTKEVYFYTDYGKFKVPIDSAAFNNTNFLTSKTYETLGYSHTEMPWRINSDIIAYGIFNGVMSEDQVTETLNNIDEEFKIGVKNVKNFEPSLAFSPIKINNKLEVNLKDSLMNQTFFQSSKPVKPFIKYNYPNINFTIKSNNILYHKVIEIKDIVLEEGIPVITKLYLYEKFSGQLLKTTNSNKLGQFIFTRLDPILDYVVRASDPKYQFQSILKDYNTGNI